MLVNLLFLLAISILILLLSILWPRVSWTVIGLILSGPLPPVVGFPLPVHANSSSTKIRVLVGIWFWHVLLLWRLQLRVLFCQTAGSLLIFAVYAEFSLSAWDATVERARIHSPFGLLVGLIALIALGLPSRMRFKISGMFTFERLALYLARFESNFFICVTPLV